MHIMYGAKLLMPGTGEDSRSGDGRTVSAGSYLEYQLVHTLVSLKLCEPGLVAAGGHSSRELTMLSLPCLVAGTPACLDRDTCVRRTEEKEVAVTQCEACWSHRGLSCGQCVQRSQGRPLAQLGRFRPGLISLIQGGGGIWPFYLPLPWETLSESGGSLPGLTSQEGGGKLVTCASVCFHPDASTRHLWPCPVSCSLGPVLRLCAVMG